MVVVVVVVVVVVDVLFSGNIDIGARFTAACLAERSYRIQTPIQDISLVTVN